MVSASIAAIFVVWAIWIMYKRHVTWKLAVPLIIAGLFLGHTRWGGTVASAVTTSVEFVVHAVSGLF